MSDDFKFHLASEIKRISSLEKIKQDKAFLFWVAKTIFDMSDDDAREAISVEGSNDKGMDMFWVDDDEGRIIIAQGKYSYNLSSRPKESHLTKLQNSLNWLSNPESLRREGRIELAQAAEDYYKAVQDGYGVEMWFIYAGVKCANIDKNIAVYNQNPDNLSKRRVIRHYHLDLLKSAWEESSGGLRRIPKETIKIASGNGFEYNGTFGKAYVATIPASELVRLHEEHEERLFDRNVRLFLGMRKGSVNAGIAETLKEKDQRGNFWAYNNGVTFICDQFTLRGSSIHIKNFSIVNGCQTTVSLAQSARGADSDVSVLARFIAASPDIVDDVIRFNNSQNPIRTWDIASQNKTQRRLLSSFSKLKKPYIYLTRRGSRPRKDLKKFRESDGKLRQIRIDIIGQYAAAFREEPVIAYKHKASIFSRHHDTIFPPDIKVEEVLFQWICGECCKSVVQTAIAQKREEEARILKKGGTLFVIAVTSKVLSLRNGATYLKTANEENVSSNETKKRLMKYADYARDAYVQAVKDQSQLENQELPTLIRSKDFYDKVIARIETSFSQQARATKWVSEALPKFFQ